MLGESGYEVVTNRILDESGYEAVAGQKPPPNFLCENRLTPLPHRCTV
ncbi:hypothetical protein RISK_003288 [Rhodopirellula islandica]|uniref:Uncharacterized protein n=1 Tax=Rhodopirellula islandica TaxID=595434 RepID=A0A0J1BDT1_RHOIS|nr:hypothetical protein RISK_003288 [Rhodopirellula islandica]